LVRPGGLVRVGEGFESEFPDASLSATECGSNFVRTGTMLLTEINRRRRLVTDLGASASQVLAIVEGAREPVPPSVIAERLLVTSGTMTSLLDTLERRGLIRRLPHPGDRRGLLIDITDEARRLLDAMLPQVHGALRDIFDVLAEEERVLLLDMLARIQHRLIELEGVSPSERAERRLHPAAGQSDE
jgi:DNA-binding MarR family transcriptional regulator